ncbi:3484_t:CDS:1, partial [Entrophospora sp. SA101]
MARVPVVTYCKIPHCTKSVSNVAILCDSLQIVGILHFGLRFQFVKMWRAGALLPYLKRVTR